MVPLDDKHDPSDNCGGEMAWLPVDRKGGADSSWRGGKSIVLTKWHLNEDERRWQFVPICPIYPADSYVCNTIFGASPLNSLNLILHTTGIHKQIKKTKKCEKKKVSTFCVPKKVRSEGSPFSPPFFQSWKKTGNTQMIKLAGTKRTYDIFGEETEIKR